MYRIVSTWSCVKTDAGVVSLDQSHLLCEQAFCFSQLSIVQDAGGRWHSVNKRDGECHLWRIWQNSCQLYLEVRWSSYNEPWPWHRDPIIMIRASNLKFATVNIEIWLLVCFLYNCVYVYDIDWTLSVLMFCNVNGNDLGALHYLNSWLGSWRGAFPPSFPSKLSANQERGLGYSHQ